MSLKINNFRGYRYRRYGALFLVAAALWFPYGVHTYFIYPSWIAFAAAVLLTAGGCVPLTIFALHFFAVAEREFEAQERSINGKRDTRLVRI